MSVVVRRGLVVVVLLALVAGVFAVAGAARSSYSVGAVSSAWCVAGQLGHVGSRAVSDKSGEQVASWQHGPDGGTTQTTGYSFDGNSNRLSSGVSSGVGDPAVTSWTYRQDNSIASQELPGQDPETFAYNDAGLLVDDGCRATSYDDFDRISQVVTSSAVECGGEGRTTSYVYDGLDRQREIVIDVDGGTGDDVTTESVFDGLSVTLVGQVDAVNGANWHCCRVG